MRLLILLCLFSVASCKNEVKTTNDPVEQTSAVEQDTLQILDFAGLDPLLSTTSNKTYVVNFWATWCGPCVKELPYFEQLNSKYAEKNVEVILVSLDFPKKYDSHLKPYIKKNELKSKVIALNDPDANAWIPKVSEEWSGAIPATLIFNKDKRQFYEKSFTYGELESEVKQFIN